MSKRRALLGLSCILGVLVISTPAGSSRPDAPPPEGEGKVVVADGRTIVVPADGSKPTGVALVTWGSEGVIWLDDAARVLPADAENGAGVTASTAVSAQSAAATYTCTVYVDNPYLTASFQVLGHSEQICSGAFGIQRVKVREQIHLGGIFGWVSTDWFTSGYTNYYYRELNLYVPCWPGYHKWRINGQGQTSQNGGASWSSSPVVLSQSEPYFNCPT